MGDDRNGLLIWFSKNRRQSSTTPVTFPDSTLSLAPGLAQGWQELAGVQGWLASAGPTPVPTLACQPCSKGLAASAGPTLVTSPVARVGNRVGWGVKPGLGQRWLAVLLH